MKNINKGVGRDKDCWLSSYLAVAKILYNYDDWLFL